MKRKLAFLMSVLMLTSPAPLTAFADGAYCPEGVPIADNTVEVVDAGTAAVLFDMRDQLLANVYAKYPDAEVHAVVASDIVKDVYVMYTSDTQAELDDAKAYCEANGFDMSIMKFYLYDESKITTDLVNESAEETQVTHGYIPDDLPVADDTIEYVDADTAAVLFDMRDQLRANVYAKYPDAEVHAVVASDIVGDVYVMYTSDTQAELDEAKAYCEENGFDMSIMRFYLYDETKIVPENEEDTVLMTGDLNGDGDVDIIDVIVLQKYLLNLGKLTPAQAFCADMNEDNTVDIFDLGLLKRMVVNEETAIEKQWDAKSIDEQFLSFQKNETEYVSRTKQIPAGQTGAYLYDVVISGQDIYNDEIHTANAKVYRIRGISPDCAVAVRFQGYNTYYSYTSFNFAPATLGEFADALNLTNTLSFGDVYRADGAILESYDASVLKTVLEDCRDCEWRGDEQAYNFVFGVPVSVDLLGIENKGMRFTEDGYLTTNLMEQRYTFYIGEDKVQEIAAAIGLDKAVPPVPAVIGDEEPIPE